MLLGKPINRFLKENPFMKMPLCLNLKSMSSEFYQASKVKLQRMIIKKLGKAIETR